MLTPVLFKNYFDRGQFLYGASVQDNIMTIRDKDIVSAINQAEPFFNEGLFHNEGEKVQAFSYLVAHFVQTDLESVLSNGHPLYVQTHKESDHTVETLHVPSWMKEGQFAFFATTYYGQKYLQLIKPYLDGAIFVVRGATQP